MDTIDCPKCEHEHQPTGSHEDDVGNFECEKCGFEFVVEIEYDPSYSTTCVTHEFNEPEEFVHRGEKVLMKVCKNCCRGELV